MRAKKFLIGCLFCREKSKVEFGFDMYTLTYNFFCHSCGNREVLSVGRSPVKKEDFEPGEKN